MTTYRLFASILGLLFLLLLFALLGKDGVFKMIGLERRIAQQTIENEKFKQKNTSLSHEVLNVRSKIDVVEEIAREDFNMIKSGEIFYRIIQNSNNQKQADTNHNKR